MPLQPLPSRRWWWLRSDQPTGAELQRRSPAKRSEGGIPNSTDDDAKLVAEFWEALRSFLSRFEQVARNNGITPQRYQLLLMIEGSERAQSTVTELSQRLHLAQNTVTDLVARAEKAGLIDRETSTSDQRVSHLKATSKGKRAARKIMTELREDRQTLEAILATLRDHELCGRRGA